MSGIRPSQSTSGAPAAEGPASGGTALAMLRAPTVTPPPLRPALFDTLRAEEEESFLPGCYVLPADATWITETRSAVIFGQMGAGKTALARAVERHLNPPNQKQRFLVVRWILPMLLEEGLSGLALVKAQVGRVMDLVARALIDHLARHPADWEAATPWCQDRLQWFIGEYLEGDVEHLLQSLGEEVEAEGRQLLQELAERPAVKVLKPGASAHLVMERLLEAWRKMGYDGIVILMDGVEPWLFLAPEQMAGSLQAFLSTLPLFECPGFSFKLLLPARLEHSLGTAGAAVRGRVSWHRLAWSEAQLQQIVERRLALALDEEAFSLDQLTERVDNEPAAAAGEAPARTAASMPAGQAEEEPADKPANRPAKAMALVDWLGRCGGESPRGWLEAVRPFLDAYQQAGRTPLPPAVCEAIQERNPPRLFLDEGTGQVLVGHRPIPDLTEGLDAVLRHLYKHRGKVCSRRDLYVTYMDALYPDRERKSVLTVSDYGGVMDTLIWRLRQAVEPDPGNPVHVVTVKGRGVRLDNTL